MRPSMHYIQSQSVSGAFEENLEEALEEELYSFCRLWLPISGSDLAFSGAS